MTNLELQIMANKVRINIIKSVVYYFINYIRLNRE